MVLNSSMVVKVAKVSAELCQYIACNPERLSSEQNWQTPGFNGAHFGTRDVARLSSLFFLAAVSNTLANSLNLVAPNVSKGMFGEKSDSNAAACINLWRLLQDRTEEQGDLPAA
ncbi:hypothetical protein ACFE04_023507 [Oxalis oulophora]